MASLLCLLLAPDLPPFSLRTAIDIAIVAFLIYQFIAIVRGRRSQHILTGLALLALVYAIAVWTHLELLRGILATIVPYTGFALIVMFQSEIRRTLARIGRLPVGGFAQRDRNEVAEEILLAVEDLSKHCTGALIVIERRIGLRTFVETGIKLDALISHDLLCSIFLKPGPLHDGAVIVQGDRVLAANCFLPLTTNPQLVGTGTRHRAAIGITEEADCLSIVISEDTGEISLAAHGDIQMNIGLDRLEGALTGRQRLKREPIRLPDLGTRDATNETAVPASPEEARSALAAPKSRPYGQS